MFLRFCKGPIVAEEFLGFDGLEGPGEGRKGSRREQKTSWGANRTAHVLSINRFFPRFLFLHLHLNYYIICFRKLFTRFVDFFCLRVDQNFIFLPLPLHVRFPTERLRRVVRDISARSKEAVVAGDHLYQSTSNRELIEKKIAFRGAMDNVPRPDEEDGRHACATNT